MEQQHGPQQPQEPIPPPAPADASHDALHSMPAAATKEPPAESHAAQETDPPRKRRLLFPKARPKKMQEFLGRRLNTSADSSEGSRFRVVEVDGAPSQGHQEPQASAGDSIGGADGRRNARRSFDDAMANGQAIGTCQQTQNARGGIEAEDHPVAGAQSHPAAAREDALSADKLQMKVDGTETSLSSNVEHPTTQGASEAHTNTPTTPQGGTATAGAAATPDALSASTALLDSSCLDVQRLTLKSPTGHQGEDGEAVLTLAGPRKSPPEKRPSSGACDCAEGEALHGLGDLGDGGLGPLKVEDFSGIPLAARLQSKVIKQRAHGCDEVVGRLDACGSCEERVKLWEELMKPHFGSIVKDTNALMGTKTVELLQALVGSTPSKGATAAHAAAFPAAAALPLLQQHGKQIISQILPNPKHFSGCCDVLIQLSRGSEACVTETVNIVTASCQTLLTEKKGNVAAIKGQGLRVIGSSLDLLLKMLESFGLQLVMAVGGVQNLMKSIGAFAACSDKRVRGALSSLAATAVYFTGAMAGDTAGASAKKSVLESLKSSKSMQTEVEKLLEKFQTEPPASPSLAIAGMAVEGQTSASPQNSGGSGGGQGGVGASLASRFVTETDVIKAVCQQQTDWIVRATDGVQPAARGDKEAEEPPWKVKMQAWQQLETALRDCVCLYKKNPFLHQQLLPLLHRVLTAEPTLPVVTCALKTLQMLVQLLLQPLGGDGSQQLQQQLQQQLRGLLPDALAKLKVNNRPVQSAACSCIGTYLSCIPLDVVVGDLLPIKEKLAHYQKLLLDEITKAAEQQAGGASTLQKVAAQLLAAGRTAAEDGNAGVRAAGVALIAAVAKHTQGTVAVDEAMQKLSEPKRQQLQKALAAAGSAPKGAQPVMPPPRRPPNQGGPTSGVPFSRMRSRGAVGASVGAGGGTQAAAAAAVQTSTSASERSGGTGVSGVSKSTFRRQGSGAVGSASARVPLQRFGSSGTVLGLPPGAGAHGAAAAPGGQWEVPHAATGLDEAEARTKELLPDDLLQNLEVPAGLERKKAYEDLEHWFRQPCDCNLCRHAQDEMDTEERPTSTNSSNNSSCCRLETLRKSAVHVLLHLRSKMRGFRERTAALEDACIACLQGILGGLLPPEDVSAVTAVAGAGGAGKDASNLGKTNTHKGTGLRNRQLPAVDKAVINVVLEPLGDRLGDPRVGSPIVTIGLLLSKCVDSPTTIAAQLALLAEGRVGGGRIVHGVCQLLEQLLQLWGLPAFSPPKQLVMIVRQMLEPSKGSRSVVFPLLKRLYAELGDKTMSAMLVAHPLPDEVKHALKQQRQQQQHQREPQLQHAQHTSEDSTPTWELAVAALTAGAAAAATAADSVACAERPSSTDNSCVSVAPYIGSDLLQRLQQGHDEETVVKGLNELMHIFVNKVGGRIKPEGLSGLVSLLRKRLGDSSASVRRHVLLALVIFCDRLGVDTPQDAGNAVSSPPPARVYKQMLPAAAECLCDSDKKVMQAAYVATARWMTALGLAESMALLSPFLSSSNNTSSTTGATSLSNRPFAGAVLRRAFSIGSSGVILQYKNCKIKEALFALLSVAMPVEASQKSLLLSSLVPHLLDAAIPQLRGESSSGSPAASALLSLVVHEACPPEAIIEVMQQRLSGQGQPSLPGQSAETALKQVLVSSDILQRLIKARQGAQATVRDPLLKTLQSPSGASTRKPPLQQDHQTKAMDLVSEESTRATTPACAPDVSTSMPCSDGSPVVLSTRSQRIQRSSGAGFATLRRQPVSPREELYQELRGRVESNILLLMFPSHGSSAAGGSKQGVPQLSQLKALYDAWKPLFGIECDAAVTAGQSESRMHPLQGEKSITDLLLKWIAYCVAEVLQQPRNAQTQESLSVLLQLLQLVMQPYNSLRVPLPLYEQQQILQQLLDVASACATTPNARGIPTPKPMSKQPRQLVRETLLLLAAIVEDRPRFLSAVHRSLIRCKNKELLLDLMAAMTRALGQHVQVQLQAKGGATSYNETLSDFLSQQCAARFFALFTDSKASTEQRNLAFDFLVLCNLALKGGTLHLLPSLSPECRARVVEATKQIAASGLSQGRLESMTAHHGDGCSSAGEETADQPNIGQAPATGPPSQAAEASADIGSIDTKLPGSDLSDHNNFGMSQATEVVPDAVETTIAKPASVDSATSALVQAVAEADALLQTGEEELRQQTSALEGWLTAARELRAKTKSAGVAFSVHLDSTLKKPEGSVLKYDSKHSQTSLEAKEASNIPVELLCCLTALKTWCAELKLRSLPRAAFGAHCLLFLLTSAPPNQNSAAATAATKAAAAASQAAVDGIHGKSADGTMQQQEGDQPLTRRSSRQHIQLTPVGEAVMSAHPLSSHFVIDGVTKALEFFFEPQHYETLHGAGLSLQGAASALLIAEAITRWRMQFYRTSSSSASYKQKRMKVSYLRDGGLMPLPDKDLLQQCCSCLLLCMGRYQDYLYKSPIAMDPRLGSVRYLVTFLLNQVLGRSILQGDARVLSSIAECCFSLAAQNMGSASDSVQRKHSVTLWRLVSKIHKKAVPLLEKHATAELQQRKGVSGVEFAEVEERYIVEALSILDLISTVVTSLSRLEGAYHAAKLLIEQRHQHIQNRKQTEENGLQQGLESRETSLIALQRERRMFLLHAKLFMHSFVTLCPALLGVHLEAAGITESAERSERLERLLRSNGADEEHDAQMNVDEPSSLAADLHSSVPQVRGAEEACRGLSNFSCAASAAAATACDIQQVVARHRRFLEEAERAQSEDCSMQVDSPSPNDNNNSALIEAFLKAKRTALGALLVRGGIDPSKDQKVGPFGGSALRWLCTGGHSIKQQPYDSSDDFMLHPFVQKVRECLLSPAQQHTLLHNHSSVSSRPSALDNSACNGMHMLRFCAGTSAVLPHHKLATLRAEAANRDCVPTDWLDVGSVGRSYKLEPQPSQESSSVLPPHLNSSEAPHMNSASCAQPEPSGCGRAKRSGELPNAVGSMGNGCLPNDANEVTAERDAVADSAGSCSTQALVRNYDATTGKGSEPPSTTRIMRHGPQRPATGSFGRSNSMRDVDRHPGELPSTPMTASRLPQWKNSRPSVPSASPTGSHERHMRGSSSLSRRPRKPDTLCFSQPTTTDPQ